MSNDSIHHYGPGASSYGGGLPSSSGDRITSTFSILHDRPNRTLSEVTLYGDRYERKKGADYYLDAVKDYLESWNDKLISQISDLRMAYYYLDKHPREVMAAKEPDPEEDEEITDEMVLLYTLNRIVRNYAALARLDEIKKNVELWARMGGIEKYVHHVSNNAPSSFPQVIKMTEAAEEIDYNTVRDNANFQRVYEMLMRRDEELRSRGL